MRVVVTGGAGFIGSHIAERLLARGDEVMVADDLSSGRPGNLPEGAALHQVSILDPAFAAVCAGADAVIHAAAQVSVAAAHADPAADALTNIVGTIRVVRAAVQAGVKRVVYLSSAAVYGNGIEPPVPETQPTAPTSAYGLSKLVAERYLALLGGELEAVTLRLANVYGPRQSAAGEAGVVARWVSALAAGAPIALQGDGTQTRDFIYAGDVAEAAALAVRAPGVAGATLNVGTGAEVALRELLALLEGATGRQARVLSSAPRPGDIQRSALDTRQIRHTLGWAPATGLAEGLAETLAWARSGGGALSG